MASETVTTLLEMHERPQLAFTRPARSGMLLRMDAAPPGVTVQADGSAIDSGAELLPGQ